MHYCHMLGQLKPVGLPPVTILCKYNICKCYNCVYIFASITTLRDCMLWVQAQQG